MRAQAMFTTFDTPHEKVKTSQVKSSPSQVKSEAPILRLRYYRKKTPGLLPVRTSFDFQPVREGPGLPVQNTLAPSGGMQGFRLPGAEGFGFHFVHSPLLP